MNRKKMGLGAINKFLRERTPSAFFSVPVSTFSGYRVAVDAFNVIFRFFAVAKKSVVNAMADPTQEINFDDVLKQVRHLVFDNAARFAQNDILPIYCFDGPAKPEKTKCKEERAEKRNELRERIEMKRKEIMEMNPLFRSSEDEDQLRALISSLPDIPANFIHNIKETIAMLGFPVLQSADEGEKLAAYLNYRGIVAAVVSNDTDAYALGTKILIPAFATPNVDVVNIEAIRENLNLNEEQMLDFCIMCGCDFNENLPGVGPSRSYDTIKKFGCIENYLKDRGITGEVLNYEKCRELFSKNYPEDITYEDVEFNIEMFKNFPIDSYPEIGYNYNIIKRKAYGSYTQSEEILEE